MENVLVLDGLARLAGTLAPPWGLNRAAPGTGIRRALAKHAWMAAELFRALILSQGRDRTRADRPAMREGYVKERRRS